MRNLDRVREIGAVLDINARALLKGQPEPYVCEPVLDAAASMGVPAVYGDDAHGVSDVGCGFNAVEAILEEWGTFGPERSGSRVLQTICR